MVAGRVRLPPRARSHPTITYHREDTTMTRTSALAIMSAAAVALIVLVIARIAVPYAPACAWETGEGQAVCVWHADAQGNGEGRSLLLVGGAEVASW